MVRMTGGNNSVRPDVAGRQNTPLDIDQQTRIHRTRAWVQNIHRNPIKRKALEELENPRAVHANTMDEPKKTRPPKRPNNNKKPNTSGRNLRSALKSADDGGQTALLRERSSLVPDSDPNIVLSRMSIQSASSLSLPPPSSCPSSERSASPSKRSTSPSKRSTSPSKRSTSPSKPRVTKELLRSCTPAIEFREYEDGVKRQQITGPVRRLWIGVILPATTKPAIPRELKEDLDRRYDTPNQSKRIPPEAAYTESWGKNNRNNLRRMEETSVDVLKESKHWKLLDVHEAGWADLVVSPLLHLIRRLDDGERLSTVRIDPPELCPTVMEVPHPILDCKIDYMMGVRLSEEELECLKQSHFKGRSINQTTGSTSTTPIFLNIEVKRKNAGVDPLEQLGVWIAAEFRKREQEGLDRTTPVLAITVTGVEWELFIAYDPHPAEEALTNVVLLGPTPMGSTKDIEDVFRIVHVLTAIATWGEKTYRTWFHREVLKESIPHGGNA